MICIKQMVAVVGTIIFSSFASSLEAQTYQTWRSEANSGSWQGNINWWKGSAGGIEFGQQEWNNNHYTSQSNDNGGNTLNTWRWLFQSGASSAHTFTGNAVRFYDSGGADPSIINQSSATHNINMAISGDGDSADPLKFQIDNNGGGGLSFGSTVNNQGSDLHVVGTATAAATVTFNGVISGNGGFYKENSNLTVEMKAANTYSGQTTIQAGTVRLSSSGSLASSNVKLHSGGSLDVTVNATVNSVAEYASGNAGTVSISSGAVLTIDGADQGTMYQNSITGAGGLTMAGSGNTTISLYGTQSYSGATTVTGGTLSSAVALSSGNFSLSGGTFRTTANSVIANSASFTMSGGTLSIGGDEGFADNGLTLSSGTSTISVDEAKTLTANGSLTGSGSLTKNGVGVLVVGSGHSAYSGTTTLGAGTLRLGADTALGTGGLTINGGTLASSSGSARSVGNNVTMGGNVTLGESATGTGNLTLSGTMSLGAAARTITVNNSSSTISGVISGSAGGSITKAGSGSLTLSNDNTFSGGVQLNDGTILVGHNNALGTGTLQFDYAGNVGTRALASADGNARTLNNSFNLFFNALTLGQTSEGTGSLTLGGSGKTFNLGDDGEIRNRVITVNGSHTIAAEVTGGANNHIVKQGSGILSLTGANTFTGGIYIDQGTIDLGGGSLVSGVIDIGGGVNNAAVNSHNAILKVSSASSFGRNITVNSNIGASGAAAGDRTIEFVNTSGTATLTGAVALEKTAEVSVASGGTGLLSGVVSGAGGLTKSGAGNLEVSNANTFDGNVVINAGKVKMSHATALGDTGTITVNAGADLEVAGGITVARNLTLSAVNGAIRGGRLMSSGASKNTYSGTVAVNNSEFDVASGNTLDVTGKISGSGTVTKTGAGELQLSNTGNDYSGITDVQNGTLTASTIANSGTASTIGTGSEVKVGSSANPGTFKYTGGTAGMNRTVTVGSAGGTINVNDSAATMTLNGTVTGSGNTLTKTGAGTLAFGSGSSVSLGTIAVQQGTLLLGAANQLGATTNAASSLNLSAGTTLKTASDLAGNVLTLAGTSAQADTIFDFDTASGNDFTFGSTTWYGGNLKLSNVAVGTVVNFGTFSGNSGQTFNDFQSKVSFSNTSLQAQINFSGTSLTVAAIPEPKVYMAAGALAMLIGFSEYRRRKRATRAV